MDAPHRLPQEVDGALSVVDHALRSRAISVSPVPSAGARGDGSLALAGIALATRTLLGHSMGLAEGGVQVDGPLTVARARSSGTGLGQQAPAHPIQ